MKIETYHACKVADAPNGRRFLAFIQLDGEFLPIRFSSATEEGARTKAQDYWDAAVDKKRNAKPRGRKPKSDIGIPISDEADIGDVI